MLQLEGFAGLSLAADAYGSPDDPAVVLLHGGGQTRRSWREPARALAAAGRYVVALDLRGHGDSAWAGDGRYDLDAFVGDLRAVLTRMPTRPVVVGSSLGGLIALGAVADGGDALVSGLVLVDAAPRMDQSTSHRMGEIMRSHAGGFATLEEAAAAARELSPGRPIGHPNALKPHLRQDADGRYYWRWDPRFLSAFDVTALARVEPALRSLAVPTMVMRGEKSPVITEKELAHFRALLPSAEFVDIEGAGHLVAADRLDAFNATLLEFLERRVPRAPLTFEAGSEARILRDALGCFGTGIVVATACDAAGNPVGLTANSFTSVSLEPPLILFCLAKSATSLPAFVQSSHFAINVLHIGQQGISARFAKRGEDRFGQTPWETWETGTPIISSSLASIECDRHAAYDGGDHMIFVGRVRRARFEPRRDPLLYFKGKYRRLHFL